MKDKIFRKLFGMIANENKRRDLFDADLPGNLSNAPINEPSPYHRLSLNVDSQRLSLSSDETFQQWVGTIKHVDEANDIIFTLIESAGVLGGDIKVVDTINSQLVGIGEIVSGYWIENDLTFVTDTNLQVTATLENDFLMGVLTFPPRNGEQSLTARIELNQEYSQFFPIVIKGSF